MTFTGLRAQRLAFLTSRHDKTFLDANSALYQEEAFQVRWFVDHRP